MRWIVSILALWFLAGPSGAAADIVRSCSGSLAPGASPTIATINGEGTCKGKTKANECRTRAREAIVACAKALFDARAEGTVRPAACDGGRGARRAVLNWHQIVKGIRANNLGDRVRWNQCCRGQSPNKEGKVHVIVSTVGDKGCGGTKLSKDRFQSDVKIGTIFFNCQKQRQKGLCDG